MIKPDKVVYTTEAVATGGRSGAVRLADGSMELDLRYPVETGGPGGGANPEQLFAMGYSACFQGALGVASRREGIDASASEVTCAVSFGPAGDLYALQVAITVSIPGVDDATVQKVAEAAHGLCPYSHATRGNIEVTVGVGGSDS